MIFSIRNKIVACFIVPIIFMVIIGTAAYQKAATGMSGNYTSSTEQTMDMAIEYIDLGCSFVNAESIKYAFNSNLQQMMLGLYSNDPLTMLNVQTETKTSMVATQSSNDFVSAVHIIPKSGNTILSTKSTSSLNGVLDEYLDSMGMDKRAVTKWIDRHEFLDETLGISPDEYILANEIMGSNNTFLVIVDIKTSTIRKFLSGLDLGDGSIVGFITQNGREVIHTNLPEGEQELISEGESVFYEQNFYAPIKDGTSTEGAELVEFKGKSYYFIYSVSDDVGATICALVPSSVIVNQAQEIRTLTIWLVLFAALIVLVVGLLIVSGIQANLKRIAGKLEEVAEGDLTVSVTARGHDEFRFLAGSATNMVSHTKKLVEKVNNATEQLAESAKDVGEASGVIDDYSKDITLAINEINEGMSRQSRHAADCVEKTDILSNEIQEIGHVVEKVETLVDNTEGMINQGMDIIRLLGDRAKETTQITSQVGESIEVLREESQVIGTFVGMITDIAEQTNLLSLNASIEAARAGDAGRGFAVVAEEIRKLADDSAGAAGEISRNVEHITGQTQNSVESAKKAQEMVALQTEAVEQVVSVFRDMKDQMSKLVDGLKEIVSGIEKADLQRGEAVEAVKNISDIIEETTGSAEAVNDVAQKLLKNVEVLNGTADALNDNMDGLRTEIAVFKV